MIVVPGESNQHAGTESEQHVLFALSPTFYIGTIKLWCHRLYPFPELRGGLNNGNPNQGPWVPGIGTNPNYLQAVGGSDDYTWELAGGSLPDNVTLNATTGRLEGTPTEQFEPEFKFGYNWATSLSDVFPVPVRLFNPTFKVTDNVTGRIAFREIPVHESLVIRVQGGSELYPATSPFQSFHLANNAEFWPIDIRSYFHPGQGTFNFDEFHEDGFGWAGQVAGKFIQMSHYISPFQDVGLFGGVPYNPYYPGNWQHYETHNGQTDWYSGVSKTGVNLNGGTSGTFGWRVGPDVESSLNKNDPGTHVPYAEDHSLFGEVTMNFQNWTGPFSGGTWPVTFTYS